MRRCAFALAALLLAGCMAPAPRPAPPPADVPAAWQALAAPRSDLSGESPAGARADGAGADARVDWWRRFDDPALASLVADALAANTDIARARAAWAQARALRAASAALRGPSLDAAASARRTRANGLPPTDLWQAGLDAGWEFDVFGGRRAAEAAARADAESAAASLGDVQVSVEAEVALAYLQLRGSQARLAIARDNLAGQRETLQLTRWRAQAGLASALEVEQALAAAAQTEATVPQLQTSIDQALHALAVLGGRPPGALAALQAAAPLPAAPPVPGLSVPADTLRQRADVRAAERRVAAAAARVRQAEAARWPVFTLSGSIGLAAPALGVLDRARAATGALVGGVSGPLFDGGAARAGVDAQAAAQVQAEAAYRATVLAALQEVEDALVALRAGDERLAALATAAEAAGHAALLARQRYGSGLVDFQVVLDTQRTLLAAQDAVAGGRTDLVSGHVRLFKALGGGWRPEDEPPPALPR